MDKVKVRVSMFDEPIDVDPDEVAGLRSQGLLVEDEPASSEGSGSDGGGDAGSTPAAVRRGRQSPAE